MEDFFEHLEDKNPDGSLNWGNPANPKKRPDTSAPCAVARANTKGLASIKSKTTALPAEAKVTSRVLRKLG